MTKKTLSEHKGTTVMMTVDSIGVFGNLGEDEQGLFIHYQKITPDDEGWGPVARYYLKDGDIALMAHKGGVIRTAIDLITKSE